MGWPTGLPGCATDFGSAKSVLLSNLAVCGDGEQVAGALRKLSGNPRQGAIPVPPDPKASIGGPSM